MNIYPFPDEIISPKEKEKASYGLQYVKAAFYTNNRFGFNSMYDKIDYQSLLEFAQGRQSVTNIKKLFGFHRDTSRATFDDGPESLAYIDIQTLNLAPKYINRAVAKMQRTQYDVSLETIDLVSIEEKKDYAAAVDAFYRLKDWVTRIGIPLQSAFPDIDVDTLPQYPDEMLYDITVNPKIKKEIKGELALKLVFWINNFQQVMREVDWDMVVYGKGHLHLYHDRNMVPRIDRINPKYWFGSYVENDNFEKAEYQGFIECITINQFLREASDQFSEEDLQKIAEQYGIKNAATNAFLNNRTLAEYDNLTYIPVVRWYFLSEDNRTFVTTKNFYGNDRIEEKSFDYKIPKEVEERFNKGEMNMHKTQTTSVYGGSWIIDSDIVWNYGRKPYPRTGLVDLTLPIKTFGTNFREGRCVSFASQMVEPVYMINVAWNKIKETIAKGRIGMREINYSAIEAVAMGKGGKEWTPREVIQYLEMTGDLIGRDNTNQYGQTNGRAVNYTATGVALADHFNVLTTSINILEQMTGTTVTESSSMPDRLPAAAVQESKFSGDLDMEYLYNAHSYLFQRSAHQLLLLTQESMRQKAKIKYNGFLPALGKVNTDAYEVDDIIGYCEYGMIISKAPGPQEWADFYQHVSIELQNGRLDVSDMAFVYEIDNLKQARQMLAIRIKQHKRELQKDAERNNKMAMDANAAATQQKSQGDIALLQEDYRLKGEMMKLEGMIKSKLQQEKYDLENEISMTTNHIKQVIEKQKGADEILKTGLRNIPDKMKSEVARDNAKDKMAVELHKINTQKKEPKPKAK